MRITTDNRGMSLVSVMVAVAILGVALMMSTSAFINASRLTRQAADFTLASNFAEGVMERARSERFDSIRPAKVASGLPKLPGVSCEVKVSPQGGALKQVTVVCAWTEGERARQVKLSTLVAKGGTR